MSRIRVLDLARELGIETKAAIIKLQELGINVKNHFNAISENEAAKLRSSLRNSKAVPEKEGCGQKTQSKIFIRRKIETEVSSTDVVAEQKQENSQQQKQYDDDSNQKEEITIKPHFDNLEQPVRSNAHASVSEPKSQSVSDAAQAVSVKEAQIKKMQEEEAIRNEITTSNDLAFKQNSLTTSTDSSAVQAQPQKATVQSFKPSSSGAVIVRKASDTPPPPKPSVMTSQNRYERPGYNNNNRRPQYPSTGQQGQGGYQNRPGYTPRPNQSQYGDSRSQYGDNRSQSGDRPAYNQNNRMGGPGSNQSQDNRYPSRFSQQQGNTQGNTYQRTGGSYSSATGQSSTSSGGYNQGARAPGQNYGRPSPAPGGAKPFVMGDSTTPPLSKDLPSRLKDRDKEKERRRVTEEESRNAKAARAKGTKFHENEDFDYLTTTDGDLQEERVVRTMIPNRKRGGAPKKKDQKFEKVLTNPTKASKKIIRIDETISVNDLAVEMSLKATVVIKELMKLGMMASINKQLDFDTATLIAQDFGFDTQDTSVSIGDILTKKNLKQDVENLVARPPIVTIMGHVDHGKTSLLDAIRKTNVASGEAGGITQHIGAYQIESNGQKITFLDTPGHEAFTAMRARGAKVTDIVVLVVAADDGVMPQTIEAVAHAKAAGVPIIVAINKIDKPGVNVERITRELSEQGVIPEEWGGETMFAQVSAKTGQGLDSLIDSILLQAEVLNLKVQPLGFAEGIVIESKLDKARGPIATIIVTQGILKNQESIVVGKTMGRVRSMNDDKGNKILEALPGTPVEIIGLNDVPEAGDSFNVVASDAIAREAVTYRIDKTRQKNLAAQKPTTIQDVMAFIGEQDEVKPKELVVIIKTDTHGSSEAIKASITKLNTAKVKAKMIHTAVGGITETDVILAKASSAIILGFNVRPDRIAAQNAERSSVKIKCFNIIYELIEAVQAEMVGALDPIKQDKVIGHAEVRNTFSIPKIGVIAGSIVSDGKVTRNSNIRIVRDGIVVYTGRVASLKRFKDDAKEVVQGFECGISVENYSDVKVGDVLEAFVVEEIAALLN